MNNIKDAHLRMNCTPILLPSCNRFSTCMCGHDIDDSYHYLLACPIYLIPRQCMLLAVSNVIYINEIDVSILLYGSDNYEENTNKIIFKAVHDYSI